MPVRLSRSGKVGQDHCSFLQGVIPFARVIARQIVATLAGNVSQQSHHSHDRETAQNKTRGQKGQP